MVRNSFLENIRKNTQERNELLKLQIMYEKGIILEEELSDTQKYQLEKLYDEQIIELDINISKKEKELKQKIIKNNDYYQKAIELKNKK